MDIKHTKRALAVSLESDKEHLSRVIHDISGSSPITTEDTLAGITHDLPLKTKYYATTVPIWLDLIESPSEWASSFLSTEASEVLAVLGSLILVFSIPDSTAAAADSTRQLIRQVGNVVHDGLGGWAWDGVKLAVGVGSALDVDEWDEMCAEAGLEFVQVGGGEDKLQQFGGTHYTPKTHTVPGITKAKLTKGSNVEKSGIPRVKEALEANEWDLASADEPPFDDEVANKRTLDDALDPENMDFGLGEADLETLKNAIFANQGPEQDLQEDRKEEDIGDEDVAKVQAMMSKLQAAREAGETMSETQRRKMAAKAVEEVMREL
ncbi:alpha-/gamma-adaptin-binding protein p34 [Beauveria brongniartii RCEF 3172]|uniref:Alpha-/gamma-adaptin-binding protein p34 n=1 Tax=Beauveria brongniartii RCEF 3172 TaxID=1081107 RepID=A0A166Z5A0_9HYPO|nr:alpha-/gamma-adaptin-binding protein p34 [Beauveria brongniartii RCEF 3172]